MTTWKRKPIDRRVRGVTLIELIAVLVIIAVIAGMVGWSVRSHVARARLAAACRLVQACDRHVRHAARSHRVSLGLQIRSSDSSVRLPDGRSRFLGRGVLVDRLWTPYAAADRGSLNVVMSPTGQSDTYAVRIKAGDRLARWVVILGASGQCVTFTDERQVRRLLAVR